MKKKDRSISALLDGKTDKLTESYKFRLPKHLVDEVKKIAESEYRSLSDQISFILKLYVEGRK